MAVNTMAAVRNALASPPDPSAFSTICLQPHNFNKIATALKPLAFTNPTYAKTSATNELGTLWVWHV